MKHYIIIVKDESPLWPGQLQEGKVLASVRASDVEDAIDRFSKVISKEDE